MDHPIALVVGASRGLGLLVSGELLDRGYTVVGCARTQTDLDRAAELLATRGPVLMLECDVRDPQQITALVERVEQEHGPIEVLITVAGIIQVGPASVMTDEHYRDAVDTMMWAPIRFARAVLPGMVGRGHGRIGTVTSIGGVVSPPHLLPYSVAKFGAVGFAEGLAADLAGTGVTSTTIVPWLMRTGSHERAYFTGEHEHEYSWFGPAASLPVLTVSAERAARKIVAGVLAGRPHVVVGAMAHLGMRFHGLAPATTVRLMGVGKRLLPDAPVDQDRSVVLLGRQSAGRLSERGRRVVRTLTTWGSRAASRYNQRTS